MEFIWTYMVGRFAGGPIKVGTTLRIGSFGDTDGRAR